MSESYCLWCMRRMEDEGVCPNCGHSARDVAFSPSHLRPGSIISNRYLVGRSIGEGGFGITYIGRDLTLQRRVAIKEYYPMNSVGRASDGSVYPLGQGPQASEVFAHDRGKFLQEAQTMARLGNLDSIVSVMDFFEDMGTAYLVMEYVEGSTLGEWSLSKGEGRASASQLLPLMRPLIVALQRLHEVHLMHRDISPDNIMVSEQGALRLIDFGLARDFSNAGVKVTVAMKPGYAPIEQITDSGQGPWTDVYSLCATLYHCLTGYRPVPSNERLGGVRLVPLREAGADVTDAQEAAIMRGLEVQPVDRTQSMAELERQLYEVSQPGTPHVRDDSSRNNDASHNNVDNTRRDAGHGAPIDLTRVLIAVVAAVAVIAALLILKPGSDTTERESVVVTPTSQTEATADEGSSEVQDVAEVESKSVEHTDGNIKADNVIELKPYTPPSGTSDSTARSEGTDDEDDEAVTEKDPVDSAVYPPVFTDATASSYLPPDDYDGKHYTYYPSNVLNSDRDSAWNEGAGGPGIGEWIEIRATVPQKVSGLRILNGYAYSEYRYLHNHRPKTLIVKLSDGYTKTWTLSDVPCSWQEIKFDKAHATTSIRLTIDDVYLSDGRFDDTCITQLEVL